MTDKDLLKAIGRIDDRFIDEAAESASASQRVRRRRAGRSALLAACLAVAVGITALVGLPGRSNYSPNKAGDTNYGQPSQTEQMADRETAAPGDPGKSIANNDGRTQPANIKDQVQPDLISEDAVSSFREYPDLVRITRKLLQDDPAWQLWKMFKRSSK